VDQTRALVEFNDKNMLTLSTCNTFGAKSERYVVEANYLP
jgi:sortase (surface protein transpeptidase)